MLKLTGLTSSEYGVHVHVNVPNPVTDSKHARMVRTLLLTTEEPSEDHPCILAHTYLELLASSTGDGVISYLLCESLTRFPVASFKRWGDVNRIKEVSRKWFSDKGVAIDVQAEVLSDVHKREITIEHIVEHVMQHKPGQYTNPFKPELSSIEHRFIQRFGFKLTAAYARFLTSVYSTDTPF